MFKRHVVLFAFLMPTLGACGQDGTVATEPVVPAVVDPAATSVIDPATGEPVATNYPKDAVFVDLPAELPGPALAVEPFCDPITGECTIPTCDPIYDFGCEPCPTDNPEAWCYVPPCTAADGLIHNYSTRRVGLEPNATLEVNSVGGSRCNRQVVTGIGARILEDSRYRTLHVEYRQPNANGTLGPRVITRTGPEPNLALEAWASVPDGYAIVGVAAGQQGTHDLRTLIVYYRKFELTSAGVRMTGPIYSLAAGVAPSGSINSQYITYSDNEVFVGVGFQSSVEQTKTIAAHVGTLP